MRLAYLIELVAALAVSLGLARWHMTDPVYAGVFDGMPWSLWLKEAVENCFTGAAIVGCAGVWAERAQRRAPASWGPGRWVWSSVGLYAILSFGFIVLDSAVRSYRHKAAFGDFLGGIPSDARANLASSFLNFMPSMLLALGISDLAVGRRDQPAADAREWSGRAFGVLIVVSSIAASMAYQSGY